MTQEEYNELRVGVMESLNLLGIEAAFATLDVLLSAKRNTNNFHEKIHFDIVIAAASEMLMKKVDEARGNGELEDAEPTLPN